MKIYNYLRAFTLCLAVLLSFTSCKKGETGTTTKDEYYVKYNIKGNGTYGYFNEFSVRTDERVVSFSGYQYKSWNQTYGPVKSGFEASATVKSSNVTIEIYISKNNGPFALKASKPGGSPPTSNTSVSYTIDF